MEAIPIKFSRLPTRTVVALALAAVVMAATVCILPGRANAGVSTKALKREARKMSNKAAKLFAKKQFRESAELFEQAYALDPRRLIRIRNAGRAYEEAGDSAKAVHCFERFLERTDNEKLKKDAKERIARLSKPAEKPAPVVATPRPAPATKAPVVAATKQPEAGSSPMPLGLAAGGGVIAITGVVWLVQTLGAEGEIDESKYVYEGGASELEADKDIVATNKLVSYSLMGVGVAAAGAGVYMMLSEPDSKPSQARLLPAIGPNYRGLSAQIHF